MVAHYFTLQALSQELSPLLRGAVVQEVFTQRKNELLVSLELLGEAKTHRTLCVSVDPKLNYLYVRDRIPRARRNSVDLFPDLLDKTIAEVTLVRYDRIVAVTFDAGATLQLRLFNTAASNIILVGADGMVREAFKNDKELRRTAQQLQERSIDEHVLQDERTFHERIMRDGSRPIIPVLKGLLPHFGVLFVREALHRAGVQENIPADSLDNDSVKRLLHGIHSILAATTQPEPTIYLDGNTPRMVSIVSLSHFSSLKRETFATVNEAVRQFLVKYFRGSGKGAERSLLQEGLKSAREQTARSLDAARAHLPKNPERYEHIGNLLLVHLGELQKGMTSVTLLDSIEGGQPINITLDPTLAPAQNAERYFEKAKKLKVAGEESRKRIDELQKRLERLTELKQEFERCTTEGAVKDFKRTHAEELQSMRLIPSPSGSHLPPFRVFTVVGGYEVWVGKNSANNDLLTMKYARQNDLWFHVRGAGGSHTVLRLKDDKKPPPREAIRQAASIAAYYSRMRKAGIVPVAFCERKYVRKPKGMREGTVFLDREEVVFVKPGLP